MEVNQKRKKKLLFTLIKIFVSITLLYLVLRNLNFNDLLNTFSKINFIFIFLAQILVFNSSFLLSIRWNIFLKKYKTINNFNLFKIYCASDFMNLFGLASIGGETYKTFIFKEDRKKVLFSSLLSRFYSLTGFLVFAISGIISIYLFKSAFDRFIFMISILFVFSTFLIFVDEKIKNFILKFIKKPLIRTIIEESKLTKKQLWYSSLFNLLFIVNVAIIYSIVFHAFSLPVIFFDFFILVSIISIALSLPISIQGIGIREFIFLKFAEISNLMPEKVIAVSIATYFLFLIYSLSGSIFFILVKKRN